MVLSSLISNAQDTSKKTLTDVQVIGIRNDNRIPTTVTYINCDSTNQYISRKGDPFFALSKLSPSIYAQSDNSQENGYSYMRMRGFDQTRINFNLNGIPLNEMEDQGLYFSNMPGFYNYLGNISIQRGIGTSKYGNTSIGGSVNMETIDMSQKFVDINTTLISNTKNTTFSNVMWSSGIDENGIGVQIGGTYLNNPGYKDHSQNDGGSIYYSIGFFKKKNIFKIYGFSGIAHNQLSFYGVPMDSINHNYKTNLNLVSDKDTFNQNFTSFNWINLTNQSVKFNTSVYFNNVSGDYNTAGVLFGVKSYQFGAMSNMVYTSNITTINIGININVYQRNHFGYDYNGLYVPIGNDTILNKYTNTGYKKDFILYLKGIETLNKTSLFYDIQYRTVLFTTNNGFSKNWNFINPKIGIKRNSDKNDLYLNIGITEREPTRTDMIQNIIQTRSIEFGNTDNSKFLDSVSVKQEIVSNFELGTKFHIPNMEVNINAYGMYVKNEFISTGVIDPYSGFMWKTPVRLTTREGIESNIKVKLSKFNIFCNMQFQYNSIPDSSSKIPFTPDFIGSIGVSYNMYKFNIGAIEQTVSSMYMDILNQYSSTPYSILNLFASYKWRNLTTTLKVNNVTDNKYYIPAGMGYSDATYTYHYVPTFYVGQLINWCLNLNYRF